MLSDMEYAFRFLPKVQPRDANGCLLWDGAPGRCGYGRFRVGGRMVQAHIVAWVQRYGPVPDGLELDHSFAKGCRSKLCVNAAHLEPVTHEENMRRHRAASRWMASILVRTELDTD